MKELSYGVVYNSLLETECNINSMNMQTDLVRAISDASPDCTFSLTKTREEKRGQAVEVDFAPIIVTASGPCQGSHHTFQIHPTFNNDRTPYTPAFMLNIEKVKYQQTREAFQRMHQARIQEASAPKEDIYVPKPSKQSRVCCICREHFEDYLEHITTVQHVKKLQASQYRKHIETLCGQFNKNNTRNHKKTRAGVARKQKKIKKEKVAPIVSSKQNRLGTETSSTQICMVDCCEAQAV